MNVTSTSVRNGNNRWILTIIGTFVSGVLLSVVTGGAWYYKNIITKDDLIAVQSVNTKAREGITQQILELQKQLILAKEEQLKRGPMVAQIPTLSAAIDAINQKMVSVALQGQQLTQMNEALSGMRQDIKDLTKEMRDEVIRRRATPP